MFPREPRGRRSLSSRRLQLVGAAGMIAYVIFSTSMAFIITGPTTHPFKELFPFFTWSLFSRISDAQREYHLDVYTLDGRIFDPPIDMRSVDVFPNFGDSESLGYKALQNLGGATSRGDKDSDAKRDRFAARFFGRHDVDYRISRHDYNPLQRWRRGPSSDEVTVIGRFSYEGGS